MPRLSEKLPSYCLHRASGQAYVKIRGVFRYLGPYNSKASRVEYRRVLAEFLATRDQPVLSESDRSDLRIVELLAAHKRFAERHYRTPDGKPTSEAKNIAYAVRPLAFLFGRERVADFGPLKLQAVQKALADGYTDASGRTFAGVCRAQVNARIGRIRRVFKWGVSQELCPPSLSHALSTLAPLQRGRTTARETERIKPVSDDVFAATLPFLPTVVADLLRFVRLTGCRPGEACALRPCDLERSGNVWLYRPTQHKTMHHGRDRTIYVGPAAQELLRPYLLRDATAFCFRPCDSERIRKAAMRASRRSPVQPSQRNRAKARPQVKPGESFTKDTLTRAVRRACDRSGVHRWRPNQLRHAAATAIRAQFGLEAAQVMLGHAKADVTQIYGERNDALGFQVARLVG